MVLVVTHEPELFAGWVDPACSWRLLHGQLQPLAAERSAALAPDRRR